MRNAIMMMVPFGYGVIFAQSVADSRMNFEVASVKPSRPNDVVSVVISLAAREHPTLGK